jgi:hypothetical protein
VPEGRFSGLVDAKTADLERAAQKLVVENIIDDVDVISWEATSQHNIYEKYFGDAGGYQRCRDGTAVYQYLFAVDQCCGDYVLHVDSDMLFYSHPQSCWIDEGIALLERDATVATVIVGHPLVAKNRFEWLLNRPFRWSSRWRRDHSFSTRCFLWNRHDIERNLLPLIPRTAGERLEETVANTLRLRGLVRSTRDGDRSWMIHPLPHDDLYLDCLDDLIWGAENGIFPFRRPKHRPWNLYTGDSRLDAWLVEIKRHRVESNNALRSKDVRQHHAPTL